MKIYDLLVTYSVCRFSMDLDHVFCRSDRNFKKEYFTIWKNNTSPEARILSPFRTPPNASTPGEASFFDHFWVDAGTLNYMMATHKSSRVSRFFRGRMKKSKNTIPVYKWPENGSFFLRPNFTNICQKIQLTSRVTVFFPYKKRFKK